MLLPRAAICLTASGPALVKSWLPILNMPTRSEILWANFSAVDNAAKSRATIRLRGEGGSRVTVLVAPTVLQGSVFLGNVEKLQPDLADARVNQADLTG